MDILISSEDVYVHNDVEIKREYLIGNHVAIDKGVYCSTNIEIGDYVHISPYVTIIGGKDGKFIAKGFNNIMAGARIICGSDRFDDSGLFGAMIPKHLKGRQIIKPVINTNNILVRACFIVPLVLFFSFEPIFSPTLI
jgi:acetyltransferase-like isoleucine patch superfamily enzyme